MIYVDLGSVLVLEDNGKQNPDECYMNKYQKDVACSYGYKLYVLMINLVSLLSHT